jgi:hypothetical protein
MVTEQTGEDESIRNTFALVACCLALDDYGGMLHMVTHMWVVLSEVPTYGRNDSISMVDFTYSLALNTDRRGIHHRDN